MTQTLQTDQQADQPTFEHPTYRANKDAWALINDLLAGTRAMRDQAAVYLPKAEKEPLNAWRLRVNRTELFNGFAQTVEVLISIILRKPPQLGQATPQALLDDAEDIDLQGTHVDVFTRQVAEDGLAKGFAGILIDMPDAPAVISKADEEVMGIRPYWVHIRAEDVINWRVERIGGRLEYTLLVFKESATVPTETFGQVTKARFRVFRLDVARDADGTVLSRTVRWELWQLNEDKKTATKLKEGLLVGVDRIPFVVFYAGTKNAQLNIKPPLEDLAHTTIAHFQVRSDRRYALHISDVPLLVIIGSQKAEGEEVYVGPNSSINVPLGGDVQWRSPNAPLEQTRQELQDLIQEMASYGLAFMTRETRAAETAEAKRMDKEGQSSRLAVTGRGLQDALEGAWGFHAAFRKVEAKVEVQLDLDFERLSIDAATLVAYQQLVAAGDLSRQTFWQILKLNRALPDDFDADAELQMLADEALTLGKDPTPALPNPDPNKANPAPAADGVGDA
jgi:hypothetical protein